MSENEYSDQKSVYLERKEVERELRKVRSQIDKLEQEIESSESKMTEMDALLSKGEEINNQEFFEEYNALRKNVDSLMPKWERLQYELELLEEKRNSVN